MNAQDPREVTITSKRGRLILSTRQDAAGGTVLLATVSGLVGLRLVRAALAHARDFARSNPQGWTYVVDTSRVRAANPANALVLRKIGALPHLERYVVVVPGGLRRWLLGRLAPLVGADEVAPVLPPLTPPGNAGHGSRC